MTAYYNEIDPYAAQWLRNLIDAGHIAPGDVDERSIEDVKPNELMGYTQCHFFAGIGIWSLALRNAGWSDDKPAWTASCPCQPFSSAGQGKGFDDDRHLWPSFAWIAGQLKPPIIFGEQVASKSTGPWFDLVQTDLERMGYAFGCVPFPSACVGAPHIRDRAYWVADTKGERWDRRQNSSGQAGRNSTKASRATCGMADAGCERREWGQRAAEGGKHDWPDAGRQQGNYGHICIGETGDGSRPTGPTNGFWTDADWLLCRDGKWRPVEPGTFPLAYGHPNRVGRLRAYGNAINAEAAKVFIESAMTALS